MSVAAIHWPLAIGLLLLFTSSLVYPSYPEQNRDKLSRIRVSTEGPFYLDEHGRVRLFHGTNKVRKEFPWYDPKLLDDKRLDDLQKWGFNIFRLGAMWAGTEPERDKFNETYVDILQTIVNKLASRGIYTMLDMHQDVMSTKYESYDGIPRWLVDTYPDPMHPYPWPLKNISYWEEGYWTQACSEGFEYFYRNSSGSIDEWVEFWGHMADRFTGNPAVIGYDLINEPWIGDYISYPDQLLPGVTGWRYLLPIYDKINQRIREVDKEGIIFYEPAIYGQAGEGWLLGSGFDRVPGGDNYINVSSYNFHMYCWALEFIGSNATDGEKQWAKEFCDTYLLPQMMRAQQATVETTGGASILSEFGLCKTYEKDINVECRTYMDLCDEFFVSWIQWDLEALYRNEEIIKAHVRPYAQAIAGVPIKMRYDDDTLDFKLDFNVDSTIDAPTEIFVPSLRYTSGYKVQVTANLRYEVKGEILLVYFVQSLDGSDKATVRISSLQV